MTIFTLTTIRSGDNATGSKRTWGFHSTEKKAREAVIRNYGNMMDCLYDYLVVERYDEGIIAMSAQEIWYHWDDEQRGWIPCPKPQWAEGLQCWAMG